MNNELFFLINNHFLNHIKEKESFFIYIISINKFLLELKNHVETKNSGVLKNIFKDTINYCQSKNLACEFVDVKKFGYKIKNITYDGNDDDNNNNNNQQQHEYINLRKNVYHCKNCLNFHVCNQNCSKNSIVIQGELICKYTSFIIGSLYFNIDEKMVSREKFSEIYDRNASKNKKGDDDYKKEFIDKYYKNIYIQAPFEKDFNKYLKKVIIFKQLVFNLVSIDFKDMFKNHEEVLNNVGVYTKKFINKLIDSRFNLISKKEINYSNDNKRKLNNNNNIIESESKKQKIELKKNLTISEETNKNKSLSYKSFDLLKNLKYTYYNPFLEYINHHINKLMMYMEYNNILSDDFLIASKKCFKMKFELSGDIKKTQVHFLNFSSFIDLLYISNDVNINNKNYNELEVVKIERIAINKTNIKQHCQKKIRYLLEMLSSSEQKKMIEMKFVEHSLVQIFEENQDSDNDNDNNNNNNNNNLVKKINLLINNLLSFRNDNNTEKKENIEFNYINSICINYQCFMNKLNNKLILLDYKINNQIFSLTPKRIELITESVLTKLKQNGLIKKIIFDELFLKKYFPMSDLKKELEIIKEKNLQNIKRSKNGLIDQHNSNYELNTFFLNNDLKRNEEEDESTKFEEELNDLFQYEEDEDNNNNNDIDNDNNKTTESLIKLEETITKKINDCSIYCYYYINKQNKLKKLKFNFNLEVIKKDLKLSSFCINNNDGNDNNNNNNNSNNKNLNKKNNNKKKNKNNGDQLNLIINELINKFQTNFISDIERNNNNNNKISIKEKIHHYKQFINLINEIKF